MRLSNSATETDERKTWLYAFIILLIVCALTLGFRFVVGPFLSLDFEFVVIYLPTILMGLIVFHLRLKSNGR